MLLNLIDRKVLYRLFSSTLSLIFLVSFGGCSSFGVYNAATGRNEFIAIPTSEEIRMGQDVHQGIDRQYTISTDSKYVGRVNRIGRRLAMVSDRQDYQYNFFVIEGDEINAFTTPGGNIYVYTGLLDKMPSDDQVAFVLAHEIGHCAARHVIKKYQAVLSYNVIGSIIFSQIDDTESTYDIARLGSSALMSLVFASYSRKDEFESDRLGIKYMYLAGYDKDGAIESLEIIREASEGGRAPLILRSHPHLKDRIEEVRQEVVAIENKFSGVTGHLN